MFVCFSNFTPYYLDLANWLEPHLFFFFFLKTIFHSQHRKHVSKSVCKWLRTDERNVVLFFSESFDVTYCMFTLRNNLLQIGEGQPIFTSEELYLSKVLFFKKMLYPLMLLASCQFNSLFAKWFLFSTLLPFPDFFVFIPAFRDMVLPSNSLTYPLTPNGRSRWPPLQASLVLLEVSPC